MKLKNDFIMTIAQISQIPMPYFQIGGIVPSDDTQRASDTAIVSKAGDVAVSFGDSWETVAEICGLLYAEHGGGKKSDIPLSVVWATHERVDPMKVENEKADLIVKLTDAGVNLEFAMKKAGYTTEEIEQATQNQLGVEQ